MNNAEFLAQGTLYPDVIESRSAHGGPSAMIKSHHNVGGLPEELGFELIEPLKELFKDEVRALGRELGLPDILLNRKPFPGPGLAVRIIGEVTEADLDVLRRADRIVKEEIATYDHFEDVWQSFAVLLPVKSVGVMGGRTDLCQCGGIEDCNQPGWYDGGLDEAALRPVEPNVVADH